MAVEGGLGADHRRLGSDRPAPDGGRRSVAVAMLTVMRVALASLASGNWPEKPKPAMSWSRDAVGRRAGWQHEAFLASAAARGNGGCPAATWSAIDQDVEIGLRPGLGAQRHVRCRRTTRVMPGRRPEDQARCRHPSRAAMNSMRLRSGRNMHLAGVSW